jgi:hypothetical protein
MRLLYTAHSVEPQIKQNYFGISPDFGTASPCTGAGAEAGAVCVLAGILSNTVPGAARFREKYVNPMLVRKNIVAAIAVARDRKFADPLAPNRLPEAPLPKAAPMSAPLPCCNSTRPTKTADTSKCKIQTSVSIYSISKKSGCRLADGDELIGHQ